MVMDPIQMKFVAIYNAVAFPKDHGSSPARLQAFGRAQRFIEAYGLVAKA